MEILCNFLTSFFSWCAHIWFLGISRRKFAFFCFCFLFYSQLSMTLAQCFIILSWWNFVADFCLRQINRNVSHPNGKRITFILLCTNRKQLPRESNKLLLIKKKKKRKMAHTRQLYTEGRKIMAFYCCSRVHTTTIINLCWFSLRKKTLNWEIYRDHLHFLHHVR